MYENRIRYDSQLEFIKYFLDVLSNKKELTYHDICMVETIFDFIYEKL